MPSTQGSSDKGEGANFEGKEEGSRGRDVENYAGNEVGESLCTSKLELGTCTQ